MSFKKAMGAICLAAAFGLVLFLSFVLNQRFHEESPHASVCVTSSDYSVSPSDNSRLEEYMQDIAIDFTTPTVHQAAVKSKNKATTRTVRQNQVNTSPYVITVYLKSQSVVVCRAGEGGKAGEVVKRFVCSSGLSSSTPVGNFNLIRRFRWRLLQGNVYGQYSTTITGNILFHSVPYAEKDPSTLKNEEYDKLGRAASKGCIRLCVRDAKWIYDNAPNGTPVSIVNQSGPSVSSPPRRKTELLFRGWDPTDKWSAGNPYFSHSSVSDSTSSETTGSSVPTQSSSVVASETEDTTASTSASTVASTSSTTSVSDTPDSEG